MKEKMLKLKGANMDIDLISDKKVFLLNPIPKEISYVDEIEAMVDLVINGDLSKIK